MKKILTIIVSYNFEKWIDKCLNSLVNSTLHTDIIVIDNNSQDNTVRIISEKWKGKVRLIISKQNLVFGRANNIGINTAINEGYDAVFLLNQDAWVDNDVITTMAEISTKYKEFGILSPIHMNGEGKSIETGFKAYTGFDFNTIKTIDKYSPIECDFINAAFWFIRTDVLKIVGLFSPLFYHYGEDKDYINRLKYHGYKLGYIPGIKGYHDRGIRILSEKARYHGVYVYLLSEYANINYNIYSAFIFSVLASIKKSIVFLLKLNLRASWKQCSVSFRLIGDTKKILADRKKNKKRFYPDQAIS